MPVIDKATGRVVAVIMLVIVAGASLRGYLPGGASQPGPPRSSASPAYVVALLAISLVIIGAAVVARLRDPRRAAASAGLPETRFGGGLGPPRRRVLLIAAGLLVGWLLVLWALARFVVPPEIGPAPGGPTASTPAPHTGAGTPPERVDTGDTGDVLGYLMAGTVALLVLTVVGAVAAVRQRRTAIPRIVVAEPVVAPEPAGAPESLARAAEIGLAEIGDLSREPREAIIACYAAMERELAHLPEAAPQDFDTPTEVLARAVEHRVLQADNAALLVRLFTEARFSSHVMTESHRDIAVGVLALILSELRSFA
ncbi:DUF4129 domain-containing protein [Mycobacterium sp.]|uniref:DUF4129 domain-containing protein n=1 Tax=Mycobacterium sp. TaxID=1785 RepID=UPI00126F0DED|nr:DUF4129 domain-containing protein [Mycobacterium sp.]KAA8960858.1 MAG: DUF4129 domain-containing protein [Mycobacterium sp.]